MQVERLVANIKNPHLGRPEQRRQIDLLQQLNRLHLAQRDDDAALDAAVIAMRMPGTLSSDLPFQSSRLSTAPVGPFAWSAEISASVPSGS